MNTPISFASLLERFFTQRLMQQRQVRIFTIFHPGIFTIIHPPLGLLRYFTPPACQFP
jgi:hypothetical protein